MRAVPPQPSGRMGVAAELFVACRRRCSGIDSSSLRDLGSQAPPAEEHLFLGQDTRQSDCEGLTAFPLLSG